MNTRADRRRRIAKACDSCRKSKVRCDGVRPVCGRCRRSDHECHYADVNKPSVRRPLPSREARRASGDAHSRESLTAINLTAPAPLRNSNDLRVVRTRAASRCQSQVPAAEARGDARPVNAIGGQASLAQALDATAAACPGETVVGGTEDMRYFGPHSGVSLFSRTVPRESGQRSPESWSQWTHPSIESVFRKRENRPLPPWAEAFSLVSDFFRHEQQAFPCYNPPAFMCLLGQQYSSACPAENPAWWAALNAVLAIAQRRRAEMARSPEADQVAWGYAANAVDSCLDVLMRRTQLLSVQAILTVAYFFAGTPNPQPSFMLVGCAVRLAHSIGLHSDSQDPSTGAVDVYMKKRVFWLAVCMDRELCLGTGRPPCHDLQTAVVDAPADSLDETEVVTTAAGLDVNLFQAHARLATVQSFIHYKLLSKKSSPAGIAGYISSFMDGLREWCSEFVPSLLENSVQRHEHLGLTRLYLSYYNTVIIANRANSFNYWVQRNNPARSTLTPDIEVSIEHCLNASRSIIDLIQSIPDNRKSFYWLNVPIILNAVILLCISAIRDPTPERTETDLQSVVNILHLFKALDEPYGNTYLTQIRKLCHELYEKARQPDQPSGAQSRRLSQAAHDQGPLSATESHIVNHSIFELGGETGDYAIPSFAPLLWDIDLPMWTNFPTPA